jgi:hypothetical protein
MLRLGTAATSRKAVANISDSSCKSSQYLSS